MLWFLRKASGMVALAYLTMWLLFLVTLYVDPKIVGTAFIDMVFTSFVGVPACIIWTVLKVISLLSAPRVERPANVVALYPPGQAATGGLLRLETPVPVPEAKRTDPASSTSPVGPDVYTYSAPGMATCPKCGQRPAIFYCLTHQSAVCLECVARHDEPGKCVYVPAFRAPKPAVGEVTISGPAKPPRGGKPGSILGID